MQAADPTELGAWLRLIETPGIGRTKARRLLAAWGSPQAIFEAPEAALREVVDASSARALRQTPVGWADLLARTLAWLEASTPASPRHVLTLADARYPRMLLEQPDPPVMLHATGRIDLLDRAAVAVVGSRNPTAQGRDNARAFARALGEAGVCVVSGLALGVDACAHEGALGTPGSTIAVVGTGLDRLYPRQNLALGQRIAQEALVISEYVLGTPAVAAHFPQRNRIIAALGLGTLVVEATLQSGSLITARLALEAGREVLAIPGSIHAPQSRGCHALIKQGAKLVESTDDILDELGILRASPMPPIGAAPDHSAGRPGDTRTDAQETPPPPETSDTDSSDPVLRALGWSPATLDVLQIRTGLSATDLTVRLLELELQGQVAQLPGQIFQRLAQA